MAEHGEWSLKRGTLSDVTAQKEYGVDREFIINGIRAGKLEYRESSIWGNPSIKIVRSQLEQYITEEMGIDYLARNLQQTEIRTIKKEITTLKKRIKELELRKSLLEDQT